MNEKINYFLMKITKQQYIKNNYLSAEDAQNISFIANIAIFQNLSQDLIERIFTICNLQQFSRHSMIYKEDDIDLGEVEVIAIKSYFKDKQIHHIQKTKANLSSINSTNNPQIALLTFGEYFGEKEHINKFRARTTSAEVYSESCQLYKINQKDFSQLINIKKISRALLKLDEVKEKWRQNQQKAVTKIKLLQKYHLQPASLQTTPRKQNPEFVKLSQTMRSASRNTETIDGPLGDVLKQTINLKNISEFYKRFRKIPSKDQSIYWIMDRETFIRGLDRIDYRVYPRSFNLHQKAVSIFQERPMQDSLLYSEESSKVKKQELFNSYFQEEESQMSMDRDEVKGINQMKIRRYIHETNKKFGVKLNRKPSLSMINNSELPKIEDNMKNNYSKISKNHVAFNSVQEILSKIERKRQKSRVTGFFYQFQSSKTPTH